VIDFDSRRGASVQPGRAPAVVNPTTIDERYISNLSPDVLINEVDLNP
jgi:hypothetical protein